MSTSALTEGRKLTSQDVLSLQIGGQETIGPPSEGLPQPHFGPYTAVGTLSSTQLLANFSTGTTGITVVAGIPNCAILPSRAYWNYQELGLDYAAGSPINLCWVTANLALSNIIVSNAIAAGFLTGAGSKVMYTPVNPAALSNGAANAAGTFPSYWGNPGNSVTSGTPPIPGSSVQLQLSGAPFTSGNSQINYMIRYDVVPVANVAFSFYNPY